MQVTSDGRRVSEWELLARTPAVFVRVASTGLTGYVTWKCCVSRMEDRLVRSAREGNRQGAQ